MSDVYQPAYVGRPVWARLALMGAAVALAAATGCSPKQRAAGASTRPTTSTTLAGPVFPLTGLPAGGAPTLGRPSLAIKIDNAVPAGPQSNLNKADVVVQELVEGGVTRFFAVFQSQDADPVGPIRSARPTDADLLRQLGGGIFAYSGAAPGEIAPVKARSTAVLISDEAGSKGFFRSHDRKAPYNLFATTAGLYDSGMTAAKGRSLPPPPALFSFGPVGAGLPSASALAASLSDRSTMAWTWDPSQRLYLRTEDGTAQVETDGARVSADNVIVMSVEVHGSGVFDVVHEEDPVMTLTGSGQAWVLRDGTVAHGSWTRPNNVVPASFTDDRGRAIALHPGRTWVELIALGVIPTVTSP